MKEGIKGGFFSETIKAAAAAIIFTFAFILIFALVLKSANISALAVKTVNQFIKAISLFVGCFLFLKREKGLLKGAVTGLLWAAFVYMLFALFGAGKFTAFSVIVDFVFAVIIGALSGVVAVNVKSK